MGKNYWLIKSEPSKYSFDDLVRDGVTRWDGVRNFAARNNLRAMSKGDALLYYHTEDERQVVGVAAVAKTAYPDPTAGGEDFSAIDVEPVRALPRAVTLAEMKQENALSGMKLLRQPRLSVSPLTKDEFDTLVKMASKKTG